MACLSSTEQVLSQLRRGCTARRNIAAGALPVKVDSIRLPDLSLEAPRPGFICTKQHCHSMIPSKCGAYLAVLLLGEQMSTTTAKDQARTYQVAVYSTCEGYHEQARFHISWLEPKIRWAQHAPQLRVAQEAEGWAKACAAAVAGSTAAQIADQTLLTAAFVYDAAAGRVVHSLGQQSSDLLVQQRIASERLLEWCPSDRHLLLVHGPCNPAPHGQEGAQGCSTSTHTTSSASSEEYSYDEDPGDGLDYMYVYVIDVEIDTVLACSRTHTQPDEEYPVTPVAWHAAVPGIIFDSRIVLEHHAAFTQAGLLTGTLPWHPRPSFLPSYPPEFSADAKYLVVDAFEAYGPDDPSAYKWGRTPYREVKAVMLCSVGVTNLGFATLECHDGDSYTEWLPHGSSLLVYQRFPAEPVIVQYPGHSCHQLPGALFDDACFSPSARVFMDRGSQDGLRIVDSETGQELWDLPASDAKWTEFMMSDCQSRNVRLKHGKDYDCDYCQWLPSGLGVICCTNEFRRAEPLSLHVLWFA